MVDGADMPTAPARAPTTADEAREADGRNLGEATLENSGPPELASDDPKVWQTHVTLVLLFCATNWVCWTWGSPICSRGNVGLWL
jgi:hypothetical protein